VNGTGQSSVATVDILKSACERHASGEYQIKVTYIRTRPEVACEKNLLVPSLLGDLPPPPSHVVDDLANLEEIIGVVQRSHGTT